MPLTVRMDAPSNFATSKMVLNIPLELQKKDRESYNQRWEGPIIQREHEVYSSIVP